MDVMDQVCSVRSVSDFRFVGVRIEADLSWSASDNEEGTAETSLLETAKPLLSFYHWPIRERIVLLQACVV